MGREPESVCVSCLFVEARLELSGLQVSGVEDWRPCLTHVFYPSAPSYRNKELVTLFRAHEATEKQEYEERVREVERGVFTPLVFSSTGGMARDVPLSSNSWMTS